MNKIKLISTLSLLILLTFCVVFLPYLINNQNENAILHKKTYWNYTARNNTEPSSAQVIKLYQNYEVHFNFISSTDNPNTKRGIAEGAAQLFETVFESDEYLSEYMNKILTDGSLICFQNDVLTVIDNRPVALNLIKVIAETSNGSLEFIYEAKTKTLMAFSCYLYAPLNNYKAGTKCFINDFTSVLTAYCKNELGLGTEEYYIQYEIQDQNYININFGILIPDTQFDKK